MKGPYVMVHKQFMAQILERSEERLRQRNRAAAASENGTWLWEDSERDQLVSMGEEMLVTLTAGQLRKLLVDAERGPR